MKLQRAHEELATIGTEACQIIASIQDEEDRYKTAMAVLQPNYPGLTNYVSTNFQYHWNIHLHLHMKLAQLVQQTPYFSTFMEKPHPQDSLATTAPSSPDLNNNVRAIDGSEDEGDDDMQEERNFKLVFASLNTVQAILVREENMKKWGR